MKFLIQLCTALPPLLVAFIVLAATFQLLSQHRLRDGLRLTFANSLEFANDVILADTGGALRPGQVYFANDLRFAEAFFNQPLTNYAVGGWDKTDFDAELNFWAPAVQTPRYFTYSEFVNAEAMLSDSASDDLRAIGGDFKRVEIGETKTIGKTDNRGLCMVVDLDEVADKDNWQQTKTVYLMQRLKRNQLRRAKTLLSAAATNTAKTWDVTASKNPDQDVRSELITAANLSGLRPNRVGYGDTSWDKRGLSYDAQDNAGGYRSAAFTPEQLAAHLMVDRVHVSKARYQSTSSAKAEIIGNLVLMFIGFDGASKEDPSNIKRFWSPCEGGGAVRVYVQQLTAKLFIITVEHYDLLKITSTLGIRQFTVS